MKCQGPKCRKGLTGRQKSFVQKNVRKHFTGEKKTIIL